MGRVGKESPNVLFVITDQEQARSTGDHNMFNAQYPMFRFAPRGPEG